MLFRSPNHGGFGGAPKFPPSSALEFLMSRIADRAEDSPKATEIVTTTLEQMARGEPLLEEREVTRGEIGFEFMLNAMRLTDGVPVALFAERTGFPLAIVDKELDAAERRGLVARDHERIAPTPLGRRFLNDLQAMFLPKKSGRAPDATLVSLPVNDER